MAPAPRPVPVRARFAVLLAVLLRVSGVERVPGMAGVKLDAMRQSTVVSALVVQAGVPSCHSLPVKANGDAAVVSVPGGHEVKLKREGGVWRVEDFD